MSRFQLACKQDSSICVCVHACVCVYMCECAHTPEITNFNTDETQTNAVPGAISHLQMSMLNKTQTGWEIHLFHFPDRSPLSLISEKLYVAWVYLYLELLCSNTT